MLNNNRVINLSKLLIIFLGISVSLWSTTWVFFSAIKSSYILYFTIILISFRIFLIFDFKDIEKSIILFLIFFLLINSSYFIVGLLQYIESGLDFFYIIEYFIKLNISIIFCLLSSKYIFDEKQIDIFFQTTTIMYIIIFSALIIVYLFIFEASFIGTKIDFEFGQSRHSKNTLAIFITLIFPFIFTYILRKKALFIGPIFLILYFIMIYKIESSTIVVISIFQLFLYTFLLSKNLYLKIATIAFFVLISPKILENEYDNSTRNSFENNEKVFVLKPEIEKKPFLILNSHRGELLYSSLQKAKNNFLLGSGLATFRIRADNYNSLTETHNSYFSILVDTGIIGLFLYIYFYYFMIIKLIRKRNLKITNYDFSCIIYISTLLLSLNSVNIEYTLSIWILNGICVSRVFIKE